MILSSIILVMAFLAIVKGYHRGFINELLKLAGIVLALIFASEFGGVIATTLRNIFTVFISDKSDNNFNMWHGIGFFVVFFIGLILIKHIIRFLNRIISLPVLKQINSILGSITSLIVCLLVVTIIIDVSLLFKIEWLTMAYQDSALAQLLVNSLNQIFTF